MLCVRVCCSVSLVDQADLEFPTVNGVCVMCYRLCFDEGQITNRLPEVVMMVAGFPTENNVTVSSVGKTRPATAVV